MPNDAIFHHFDCDKAGEDVLEIWIFPSGIKIFQNDKFRFIVIENNKLKEITEKELFEKVVK